MGTLYGGPAGTSFADSEATYRPIEEQPREALERLAKATRIEKVEFVDEWRDDNLPCVAVDMTIDGTQYKIGWLWMNAPAIADLLYAAKGGDENHAYILKAVQEQAQEALTNPQG